MIPCPPYETLLDFLADRLPPDEDRSVSEHVQKCTTCTDRLRTIQVDDLSLFEIWPAGRLAPTPIDAQMQQLVERLYRVDDTPSFRELASTPSRDDSLDESVPGRVGRFLIERRLGAGGFGLVVAAIDPVLQRRVALKLPRAPAIGDPVGRVRFLREAKAAANLHHPNIIPVFEAAEADGLCYLAAAYCRGPNLAKWLTQQNGPIAPDTATRIVQALAEAVEHAHRSGILHRDIKPSNVLLDPDADSHGLSFTPKLTDFGLAKLRDTDANETKSGVLLGTPRYMAPEQAAGRKDEVGPHTDVYALGAVLYELLTAQPPISGDDNADTLRRVVSDEPPPPSRLVSGLPRDLEAICMKCLEKAPGRRYRTAANLASDLQRFLSCEPTEARPLNSFWRLQRWCRRKPVVAVLLAVLLLAATIGPPVAVKQSLLAASEAQARLDAETAKGKERRAREDGDRARQKVERQADAIKEAAENLRVNLYRAEMDLAGQAWREGDMPRVLALLDQNRPKGGEKDLRGFEWFHWWRRSHEFRWRLDGVTNWTSSPRISPNGQWIAIPRYDSQALYLYDGSGKLVRTSTRQHNTCVAFSPDGQLLTYADSANELKIVDVSSGELRTTLTGTSRFCKATFAPDGHTLATLDSGQTVTVWDLQHAQPTRSWKIPEEVVWSVAAIRYSPDGSLLITCPMERGAAIQHKGAFRFWNVATGDQSHSFGPDWLSSAEGFALSPDGSTLAVADGFGVRFWDIRSGEATTVRIASGGVKHLMYAPGGRLATCHSDAAVRFWDLATGELLETFKGHSTDVGHLAFSADGLTWLSSSSIPLKELLVWDMRRPRPHQSLKVHAATINVATGRNASIAVSRDAENSLKTWDLATGQLLHTLAGASPEGMTWLRSGLAMSDDGAYVAAGDDGGKITIWNATSGKLHVSWQSDEAKQLRALAFSTDGSRLASAGSKIAVWNVLSGELERTFAGHPRVSRNLAGQAVIITEPGTGTVTAVCFSPDDKTIATAGDDYRIRLWDVATGDLRHELIEHRGVAEGVSFSADASMVASTSIDRTVKLWDAKEGRLIRTLSKRDIFSAMAFSPDGKVLAFAGPQNTVRLWHLPTSEICSTLDDARSELNSLAFAGGGSYLVGASGGQLHIWRTATLAEADQLDHQIGELPPDLP